jgi:hypothetical protein
MLHICRINVRTGIMPSFQKENISGTAANLRVSTIIYDIMDFKAF